MNKKISVKLVLIFFLLIQLILVSNDSAIAESLDLTSRAMEVGVTPTDIVGNVGTALSSAFTVSTCTPEVTVSPKSATINPGGIQQFSAETICNGESVAGTYAWEISEQGCMGSTIDNNGLYTACLDGGMDTIKVTDIKNENITDTAEVTVYGFDDNFFVMVDPGIIPRSCWIMLPAWIDIWGVNCNFDLSTRVAYEPRMSVLQMPPLVTEIRHIRQLVFVMPSWFAWALDETLTVTVTTEFGVASDTIEIKMRTPH